MTGEDMNTPAGSGGMRPSGKIAVVVALAVVVGFVLWSKNKAADRADKALATVATPVADSATPASQPEQAKPGETSTAKKDLPRLVDLGAGKCIPCKKMAPILEELKKSFAGRLEVEFIDVWQNPNAGELYGVRMIPTQIFYDAAGKEQFRHEGFFSREDILAKWKELGVALEAKPVASVVREGQ